jgi:hypothetical protein
MLVSNSSIVLEGVYITYSYIIIAPEVLSASGYDLEVDLWSVGVIAYLL